MRPIPAKENIRISPFFCKGDKCIAYNTCRKEKSDFCELMQELTNFKNSVNIHQASTNFIEKKAYSKIELFPQDDRPLEAKLPEAIQNAAELRFMARSGINFLGTYSQKIEKAIKNGCICKFIVFNENSQAIEYGSLKPNFDKSNTPASYEHLHELKKLGQNKVKIHVLNQFPPFSLEYYNYKNNEQKIIIVRPHSLSNFSSRPMFMLHIGDYWFDYFYNEFDSLWEKSQEWGIAKKWGKPKRIIIDGTPGAGKTTLLTGKSDRDDMGNREFAGSFAESGYTVFGGLINDSIKKMREKTENQNMQPADDWALFFEYAVDHAIKSCKEAKQNLISFYDRSILFLEQFAKEGQYQGRLPEKYYNFVNDPENRFDDPVFIFRPIPGYKVTPRPGDADMRNCTFEQLEQYHLRIVDLYERYNYRVVIIDAPADSETIKFHDKVQEHVDKRLEQIKKELDI
jgi:predicted ATPase